MEITVLEQIKINQREKAPSLIQVCGTYNNEMITNKTKH